MAHTSSLSPTPSGFSRDACPWPRFCIGSRKENPHHCSSLALILASSKCHQEEEDGGDDKMVGPPNADPSSARGSVLCRGVWLQNMETKFTAFQNEGGCWAAVEFPWAQ